MCMWRQMSKYFKWAVCNQSIAPSQFRPTETHFMRIILYHVLCWLPALWNQIGICQRIPELAGLPLVQVNAEPVKSFMTCLVLMVWGGISKKGCTDLYRLGNDTLTAIRYLVGCVNRLYTGAVGPGLLWSTEISGLMGWKYPRIYRRIEELRPFNGPRDVNSVEHLWDVTF